MPGQCEYDSFNAREMFQVHLLNEEGRDKAAAIAVAFTTLVQDLETVCTPSPLNDRELSIMFRKLEEACFFAKRAMAKVPENQASNIHRDPDPSGADFIGSAHRP